MVVANWAGLSSLDTAELTHGIFTHGSSQGGQMRMTRLVWALRKSIVTLIITLYNCGEQKSILECRRFQTLKWMCHFKFTVIFVVKCCFYLCCCYNWVVPFKAVREYFDTINTESLFWFYEEGDFFFLHFQQLVECYHVFYWEQKEHTDSLKARGSLYVWFDLGSLSSVLWGNCVFWGTSM